MKVEVLYFEGCPNHKPAVSRVREVLRAEGLTDVVEEIEVHDDAEAAALKFLGSPSVNINGIDIEPEARDSHAYGFGCRTYVSNGIRSGVPSAEMVRSALRAQSVSNSSQPEPIFTHSEPSDKTRCCQLAATNDSKGFVPNAGAGQGALLAGGLAAFLASTCCLGPLVLVSLGFSGAWIGNLTLLEPYRPYFLAASILALAFAACQIFRPAAECQPNEICARPQTRRAYKAFFTLSVLLVVVGFAFPYIAKFFY